MTFDYASIPDSTPILVGSGQVTVRAATDESPVAMAGRAAAAAIADAGAGDLARTIDTVGFVRLFTDSSPVWNSDHGRCDNPPASVAKAIGAAAPHLIYSAVGGNQPLSLLFEFARDIASETRDMVLVAGAEALLNQKKADRAGRKLHWSEDHVEDMDDRPMVGSSMLTRQEVQCGLHIPISMYSLIEQARRHTIGVDRQTYERDMAALLEQISRVACENEFAQFPERQTVDSILETTRLTSSYTAGMVAKDGVNQAAAILLCSVGRARALGIDPENWVFIHGLAEGEELRFSERVDPGASPIAGRVAKHAVTMAGQTPAAISHWDIYSCFPCAVSAVTDALELPTDGGTQLSLTGGLPFFGGPGNDYSLHALAEAVSQCRRTPDEFTAVTANGGFLSKHAAGVFSCRPRDLAWRSLEWHVSNDDLPRKPIAKQPRSGSVVAYAVRMRKGASVQAVVLGETANGARFVCSTARGDEKTIAALEAVDDATGMSIDVHSTDDEHQFHFTLGE